MLLNPQTGQRVPLFWQQSDGGPRWLRWPIDIAIDPSWPQTTDGAPAPSAEAAILCQLKPALALPLRRGLAGTRDHSPLLEPVYKPLTQILSTLKPEVPEADQPDPSDLLWRCCGLGLAADQFERAMANLLGVGVSYPGGWSSQYQTNLQNAILGGGLVSEPSKIHFIEETTAAVLACLRSGDDDDRPEQFSSPTDGLPRPPLHAVDPEGLAFAISAGASTTEVALVDLAALVRNPRAAASSQSFAYGGQGLDQDILYYILYPQLQASPLAEIEQLLGILQLDSLAQPQLGQPDSDKRRRLHLRLCSSAPGRQLLAIAQRIKHELQVQPRVTYTLAQHRGQVTQDELGHQILLPYIRTLNHQTQSLFRSTAVSPRAVSHVICSGGIASMRVVELWARRCFTEAELLRSPTVAALDAEVDLPASAWLGSQVGYGLASLPLVIPDLGSP
ncbi:MAG: hypothetical protein ACFB4J_07485 [Elainellaceae cyanobacterium]